MDVGDRHDEGNLAPANGRSNTCTTVAAPRGTATPSVCQFGSHFDDVHQIVQAHETARIPGVQPRAVRMSGCRDQQIERASAWPMAFTLASRTTCPITQPRIGHRVSDLLTTGIPLRIIDA